MVSGSAIDARPRLSAHQSSPNGSQVFQKESLAMRNRLQVSFWGIRVIADGVVAIAAALLILMVFAVVMASWP
jgi:hypothetical protein